MVELLSRYSNHADQMKRLRRLLELPTRKGSEPVQRQVRARRHLSDAEEFELLSLYQTGRTVYEVADELGMHRNTVSVLLERHGIERRYHQTTDVDLDQATVLQQTGLNLTEVAAALGIGRTTLVRARRAARVL